MEPKAKSLWRWEQFSFPWSGALSAGQAMAAEIEIHFKQSLGTTRLNCWNERTKTPENILGSTQGL